MRYYKSEKYFKKGQSILKRYLMLKRQTVVEKINQVCAEKIQICSQVCCQSCKMDDLRKQKKRFNFKLRKTESSPSENSSNQDKVNIQSNILLNDPKNMAGTSKQSDNCIPSELQALSDFNFEEEDLSSFKDKMNFMFDINLSDSKNELPSTSSTQASSKKQPSSTQTSDDISHIGHMDFFTQEALTDEKERLRNIVDVENKYILKLKSRKRKLKAAFQKEIIDALDKQIFKVQKNITKHANRLFVLGRHSCNNPIQYK